MSKRSKKRAKPEPLPNPWEWAWQKIPKALKPLVLFLALGLLIAAFVLGIIRQVQKIILEGRAVPTEVPVVYWLEPEAIHLTREIGVEYTSLAGCLDRAHLISTEDQAGVASAPSWEEKRDALKEYGWPLAPAVLSFSLIREPRSEIDQLVITFLNLQIESYEPLTTSMALVLTVSSCASQYLPETWLGDVLIVPDRLSYDVLQPRTSTPSTAGVEVTSPYEGLSVGANALEPGLYVLSLTAEYVLNGQQLKSDPLVFRMAVPDNSKIAAAYGWDGTDWVGPEDPAPFLTDYWVEQGRFVGIEFVEKGQTRDGLRGQYTYLTNSGADIDLTGWTLTLDTGETYYTFPAFTLRAGAGVRVWEGAGTDTNRDLFGARDVFELREGEVWALDLRDPSNPDGRWTARWFLDSESP